MKRYELNVAANTTGVKDWNGVLRFTFYCKITLRDWTYDEEAQSQAKDIANSFNIPGHTFKFTLTRWEETGRTIEL